MDIYLSTITSIGGINIVDSSNVLFGRSAGSPVVVVRPTHIRSEDDAAIGCREDPTTAMLAAANPCRHQHHRRGHLQDKAYRQPLLLLFLW